MIKILLALLLFSTGLTAQTKMAVFIPSQGGWVYKTFPDSAAVMQQISTLNSTVTTIQTPADGSIAESKITNLVADLGLKAPLASPTFTGTVTLPALTVTSGMLAGSIPYSKLALTGAILNADLAGSIAYSKLSLTGAILNADLAGAIAESKVTNLVTDLAAKQGIASANTSATTGTMTVTMTSATQTVFRITPTGACTFNASGGVAGARMTFIVTTSGSSSFVLTFGTNFRSTGTLATGTVTAKKFSISFNCEDGTTWVEEGRTIAM